MVPVSLPSRGRILIVDDLPNWRETLSDLLRGVGYDVYTGATPDDALRIFRSQPIDVAILDVRLDDRDMYDVRGTQLLQEIRQISPQTSIVIMTGFPMDGLLARIQQGSLKADVFWPKNPAEQTFDIDQFLKSIHDLVLKSRYQFNWLASGG